MFFELLTRMGSKRRQRFIVAPGFRQVFARPMFTEVAERALLLRQAIATYRRVGAEPSTGVRARRCVSSGLCFSLDDWCFEKSGRSACWLKGLDERTPTDCRGSRFDAASVWISLSAKRRAELVIEPCRDEIDVLVDAIADTGCWEEHAAALHEQVVILNAGRPARREADFDSSA